MDNVINFPTRADISKALELGFELFNNKLHAHQESLIIERMNLEVKLFLFELQARPS